MKIRGLWLVLLALLLVLTAGCYAAFSPQMWRNEIERQTGAPPRTSFEFNLDGATMKLAKTVVSGVTGDPVNFGGLDRLDVAVFELPSGRRLDFDRIRHRGWDRFVRTSGQDKSDMMILVRTNGETLADMVLIAQGEEQVLYGRLKGTLDPGLPSTFQKVLQATGLKGLKDQILSKAPGGASEPPPSERKK